MSGAMDSLTATFSTAASVRNSMLAALTKTIVDGLNDAGDFLGSPDRLLSATQPCEAWLSILYSQARATRKI